eukprot:TRINITY_DN105021_c0_g1_i1.p1 TRINITY_DN105021_c0_g1~~TRINITY_DN105021_c0_g1_i1.p1  ORF type:complete len:1050 (+),score=83.84 TRINITY_DN105021_c0_g1_i1:89-3151(+)
MPRKKDQESCESILKGTIFELYTVTLMQNQLSFTVWVIFYLISYFQMLDFTFHAFYDEISGQSFLSSLILQVFSAVSVRFVCLLIQQVRTFISIEGLFIVILVGGSAILMYLIIGFIYYLVTVKEPQGSNRKVQKLPGLSFLFLIAQITSMILFYPITLSYMALYVQNEKASEDHDDALLKDQVIKYGSWVHVILVILIAVLWLASLVILLLNILFTTELSTRRLVTWSVVQPYSRIIFFLLKLTQAFFLTAITTSPIVELIIVLIITLLGALVRVTEPISTVSKVFYMEAFSDAFYIFACIYALTTLYWELVDCSFLLGLVFAACAGCIHIFWLRRKLYNLLILPYVLHIKHPSEGYNFLCKVQALLAEKDEESRGLLAGIALNHNRICENTTCWCNTVKNAMSTKGQDPGHTGDSGEQPALSVEITKADEYNEKSRIGRWLLALANDIMMSQNNALMNISIAYIYYFHIGNPYQSLNYLDNALTHKPSFLEEFAVFLHRRKIEMDLIIAHDQNLYEGAIPLDVSNVLTFSDLYNRFLEIIEDCANTYQSFWKELRKDLPESTKLSNYGKEISEKWIKIQALFNKLLVLMPKNMNYLYLFGLFIKYITNDSEEAKKVHQKLVYIRNSKSHLKGPEYEKFTEEGRAMMLRVSGSKDSLGVIKEINVETEKILGYPRNELQNHKINKLMCQPLAETHDLFVAKFYETLISNKVNKSSFQYAKEKSGFFIPIQLLIRLVPNLSSSLEFCALFYRNESSPYVLAKTNKTRNRVGTLICDELFRPIGITRNCARTLKIPDFIVTNKGFPENFAFGLFPCLKDKIARDKISEPRGRVISYNTSRLCEFLADEEEMKQAGLHDLNTKRSNDILVWIRLVEQNYSDSKAILNLLVIDQVPNVDATNYINYDENGCQFYMNPSEGSGPKVVSMLPHIFRMNSEFEKKAKRAAPNPFDYAESVFAESMLESLPSTVSQSSSSIGTISKDLTTFKERISEIKDPHSVKRLRGIFISFVLFLIGIVSKLFF